MSWSIGLDTGWNRDIGYGVPAYCDEPGCMAEIDRGLSYVCCGTEPYGGEHGCGRYYCSKHERVTYPDAAPFDEPECDHSDDKYISKEHPRWIAHKLTDPSWHRWRQENPREVKRLKETR